MTQQNFVAELSKLEPKSTFLTVKGYQNEHQEIADFSIVFHIDYMKALQRSILQLQQIKPISQLEHQAKQELLDGYKMSLSKMAATKIEDIDDHYTRFFDAQGNHIKGVKLHTDTQTLHLYGFVVHKKILVPGNYPTRNKRELTLVKDRYRQVTSVHKFRQFKITPFNVNYIKVQGLKLLPPP